MANTLGAGHALFDHLSGFVCGDRRSFTTAATVNFAYVFEYVNLHRHNLQLFAGFFTDDVFAAAASAGQFVLGQFVVHFDAWQISRQWLAFAATWRRSNNFFVSVADWKHRLAFGLIEQRQLRRIGLDGLLGFSTELTVAQKLDLFFQIDDMNLVCLSRYLLTTECLKQHLLEQNRIIGKVFGYQIHAGDYTRQATNLVVKTL